MCFCSRSRRTIAPHCMHLFKSALMVLRRVKNASVTETIFQQKQNKKKKIKKKPFKNPPLKPRREINRAARALCGLRQARSQSPAADRPRFGVAQVLDAPPVRACRSCRQVDLDSVR